MSSPQERDQEQPRPKEFVDADLSGARFVRSDLSGAVLRGVNVAGIDIDAPWLLEGRDAMYVNGVDVAPYVDSELNRRLPGRSLRRASDPVGLREAWAALELVWTATVARVETMPPGAVDVAVDGEWSFAQTLRHLVMATDTWLGRAILEREQPYHPIGQPHAEYEMDGYDLSVFATDPPSYPEVLEVRAERIAMVRGFLATVTTDDLAVMRENPWSPTHQESTLSCLHTILEEEWEHHRYAVRDLAAVEGTAQRGVGRPDQEH